MNAQVVELNKAVAGLDAAEILKYASDLFGKEIAFATSLGLEDQAITHMIVKACPEMRIFTLDTGRLYQEVYDLLDKTQARYSHKIEVYFPDTAAVEQMVNEHGINLFYDSVEKRKLCCHIRKTQPLKRALKGCKAWVTGLRKEQSVTRTNLQTVEWDELNGLIKINPLLDWTEKQLRDFIDQHHIPYNPLHDQGFPSIGCQPCTRAIQPGEDVRAGRWWWERPDQKECGLHQA